MMNQALLKLARCFGKALVLLAFVVTPFTFAATHNNQTKKPVSAEPDQRDDVDKPFSAMEEEMRAKRAIKYAEKEYQENLDRARELSSLGASIVASFKHKNLLEQEDIKKLEKVEKLAKGIRHAAGGSEDDVEMEKPPTNMASAIEMLDCLSQSLKVKVEKTPKHVISAAVIDEANVLLELVRIVRNLSARV